MVKGVAVLSSSEGVSGTVFFNQEGDGNFEVYVIMINSIVYLVQIDDHYG